MKRRINILKIATIFTTFALGFACLTYNFAKSPIRANAEQRVNYNYSGVRYNATSANEDPNWNINLSLRGAEFRNALQTIMESKQTVTTTYSECLEIGARAAAYPNSYSSTFVPFYHDSSVTATVSQCNREHTWPNSRGSGKSGPGADPFIIRPTLTSENSDRGNLFYGTRSNEWDPASCGFEGARGESARVILYAATMYYKNGLSLSNNPNDSTALKTMGTLSTLLTWNTTYAPTPIEIQVNNYLSDNGYGRNPFVDHPEYASYIWNSDGLIEGGTSQEPTSISLNKTSLSLTVGQTNTLIASFQPDGASGSITWSSNRTSVATVNSSGKVTAIGEGTATITAKYSDTIKATCTVTVTSGGGGSTTESLEKASSIDVGDTVFLTCDSKTQQYAGPSSTSTVYGVGSSYTGEPDTTKYALEVESGSSSNTYSFKIKSGSDANKYLTWVSGNSLDVTTSKSANASWTVTFDASNNATIKNVYDSSRVIWWNVSSPRFACYTGKSDGSDFKYTQLWKLTISSTYIGPETYLSSATEIATIRGSGSVSSSNATNSITFADLDLTSGTQYADPFNGGCFTVTFSGGENDGKYYDGGTAIRTYGGGAITIAAKSGTISSITLTWDGSYKPTSASVVNVGTYSTSNNTWTGSSSSVVFTRPSGSGHWRLQSVTVICISTTANFDYLDLRFGIKIPTADWGAIEGNPDWEIQDYGLMMFKTNSLTNVPSVPSRYDSSPTYVAVGHRNNGLTPDEDGLGNYNFFVKVSIPNESEFPEYYSYATYFCVRPFVKINNQIHWLLDHDIQESVKTLAGKANNTNLGQDVLDYLAA